MMKSSIESDDITRSMPILSSSVRDITLSRKERRKRVGRDYPVKV
jgi:hypothetical protein